MPKENPMSLNHITFFSKSINIFTNMTVILPEFGPVPAGGYPTLYLLHGYTDDFNAWTRWTAIERYAGEYQVVVVMPDVQKSFYCDFANIENGYKYWTFASEELIDVTRRFFRLSNRREDTSVAGLSMGGFGAFKCALNRPDVFGSGANLSGVIDIEDAFNRVNQTELKMVLGDLESYQNSPNDLFVAAERTSKLAVKPRLYQFCGTDDFLYESNIKFKEFIGKLGFDYTYEEAPGGHEWRLWDIYILKVLQWLNLEKIGDFGL